MTKHDEILHKVEAEYIHEMQLVISQHRHISGLANKICTAQECSVDAPAFYFRRQHQCSLHLDNFSKMQFWNPVTCRIKHLI